MSLGNAIKYNRETGNYEWSEGYRYEDLTDENKNIIDWCNHLIEDIEGFKADYEIETEDISILEKTKNEIAIEVISNLIEYLKASVDEYQVALIENQPEEDEENV